MSEPKKTIMEQVRSLVASMLYTRFVYAGLSACHGWGCFVTDKPELYATMGFLYALKALKG